jgi:hypothetical protein
MDSHWKTRRALRRPRAARTAEHGQEREREQAREQQQGQEEDEEEEEEQGRVGGACWRWCWCESKHENSSKDKKKKKRNNRDVMVLVPPPPAEHGQERKRDQEREQQQGQEEEEEEKEQGRVGAAVDLSGSSETAPPPCRQSSAGGIEPRQAGAAPLAPIVPEHSIDAITRTPHYESFAASGTGYNVSSRGKRWQSRT